MKDLIIYIPTYNRAESLMNQLRNIAKCKQQSRIKVILKDNCSTEKAYIKGDVEKFCLEHGYTYLRNVCNIGANPNIVEGFTYCDQGNYVWILSDDDLINEIAVDYTLGIIDRDKPDIVYYTHTGNDEGNVNKFSLDMINNGLGLISCVIYKTEVIRENIRAGYDNLLSCFPHLAILLESIKKGKSDIKIYSINKNYCFSNKHNPIIYSEGLGGYRRSLYGFILLTNNLDEKSKRVFINEWWNKKYNKFAAAKYSNLNIEQYVLWKEIMRNNIVFFRFRFIVIKAILPAVEILYTKYFRKERTVI